MSAEDRVKALRDAGPDAWVAFAVDETRVVAVASSYEEAVAQAAQAGENNPLLAKNPPSWLPAVL